MWPHGVATWGVALVGGLVGGGPGGGPLVVRLLGSALQAAGLVAADAAASRLQPHEQLPAASQGQFPAAAQERFPAAAQGQLPTAPEEPVGSASEVRSASQESLSGFWQPLSASGSPAVLAAGLAVLAAAEPDAARAAAEAAAGALLATGVAKLAMGRARPYEGAGPHAFASLARSVGGSPSGPESVSAGGRPSGAGGLAMAGGLLPFRNGWMAMPSGHAAGSWAVAHRLARRWPQAAPLLYGWAISVSLSRVALQEHWPSDTWVGMRLGLTVATLP